MIRIRSISAPRKLMGNLIFTDSSDHINEGRADARGKQRLSPGANLAASAA
jgi:hypothetical protein